MLDLKTAVFQRSLSETIAWCAGQSLSSRAQESPETRHRRALARKAARLLQRTHQRGESIFYRLICEKRDRHRATKMLETARLDSLALLKHQLRTPLLQPQFSLAEASTASLREQVVTEVITKRTALLSSREASLSRKKDPEKTGRLLLYFPEDNLADGAAQYSSNGFFDLDNVPPWDTWVHYADSMLVSWVPAQLIALAQRGIDVNPEECIRWAD